MKYAIIGAGGTGGTLGFYLTEAGKDVTLIARGYHLEAMQKQGLTMRQLWDGKEETIPVKACRMEEYTEQPDVILVCVKGYSLTNLIPDIRRIAVIVFKICLCIGFHCNFNCINFHFQTNLISLILS